MFLSGHILDRFWSTRSGRQIGPLNKKRQTYYFSTQGCSSASTVCLTEAFWAAFEVKKLAAMADEITSVTSASVIDVTVASAHSHLVAILKLLGHGRRKCPTRSVFFLSYAHMPPIVIPVAALSQNLDSKTRRFSQSWGLNSTIC